MTPFIVPLIQLVHCRAGKVQGLLSLTAARVVTIACSVFTHDPCLADLHHLLEQLGIWSQFHNQTALTASCSKLSTKKTTKKSQIQRRRARRHANFETRSDALAALQVLSCSNNERQEAPEAQHPIKVAETKAEMKPWREDHTQRLQQWTEQQAQMKEVLGDACMRQEPPRVELERRPPGQFGANTSPMRDGNQQDHPDWVYTRVKKLGRSSIQRAKRRNKKHAEVEAQKTREDEEADQNVSKLVRAHYFHG